MTIIKFFLNFFAIVLVLTPLHCIAFAGSSPQHYENFENVQFVKNYDGDSITFNIPNTPAIVGKNMVIRLRGIDAPELKKKTCQAEHQKALAAKQFVFSLLSEAQAITLHNIERGKYFRILADVKFDGQDLATALLKQNLAVHYSGGKKEYNWCREPPTKSTIQAYPRPVLPPKISGVYVWPPPPLQNKEDDK